MEVVDAVLAKVFSAGNLYQTQAQPFSFHLTTLFGKDLQCGSNVESKEGDKVILFNINTLQLAGYEMILFTNIKEHANYNTHKTSFNSQRDAC